MRGRLGRLTPEELERKALGFCRRLDATGRPWEEEFRRWALRYWSGLHIKDLTELQRIIHAELFGRGVTTAPPSDLAA
jgi:hypothetical protein